MGKSSSASSKPRHLLRHPLKHPLKRRGWFEAWLGVSLSSYVLLILLLIFADIWLVTCALKMNDGFHGLIQSDSLWFSVKLTFLTCTISAVLALIVAIPIGYALSRYRFWGRSLVDVVIDIPLVLPPLVIGLSLLILFNYFPPKEMGWQMTSFEQWVSSLTGRNITHTELAIVVAQFTVAVAFAVRAMKASFDQIDPRSEQVAMTLGASRGRAFWDVVLPQASKGLMAAGTLAWARALGEFGPILVFAGTTQGKVNVLSTAIYLELNTGNVAGAVMIALLMITMAVITIFLVRWLTDRSATEEVRYGVY